MAFSLGHSEILTHLYNLVQPCLELLQVLEGTIAKDKSFHGYKGGEYSFKGYQQLFCEHHGVYKEFTPSISGMIEEELDEYVILTTVSVGY